MTNHAASCPDLRPLGRSDIAVPAICLGTMTWGEQNTEAEGHAQMDYALERGVNFFDTAELYAIPPRPETQGATERIIGSWLAARGVRDKVILATKVVGRTDMTWFREGKPGRLTAEQMTFALERSLRNLRTDHVDLYQLHWPDRAMPWGSNPSRFSAATMPHDPESVPIEAQLETLQRFIEQGKVRTIGLSNESAWGVMRFVTASERHGLPRVQSVQNAYNLLNRTFETALAEIQQREQVGLLAYSPLAQGFLTGKYLGGAKPAGARNTLFNRGARYEKPGAEEAIRDYVSLARDLGVDPAALAIAFVTSRPFTTSTIIGATSLAQLQVCIDQALALRITPEIEARIDHIHQLRGNTSP